MDVTCDDCGMLLRVRLLWYPRHREDLVFAMITEQLREREWDSGPSRDVCPQCQGTLSNTPLDCGKE